MTDKTDKNKGNKTNQSVSDLWNVEKNSQQNPSSLNFDNDRNKLRLAEDENIVPRSVIRDSYTIKADSKKTIKGLKKKFKISRKNFLNILKKIKIKKINFGKVKNIKTKLTTFNMKLDKEHSHNTRNNKTYNFLNKLVYSYVQGPQFESRLFGLFLLFTGLIGLGFLHYSKKIPDSILPLTSIGMEDSGNVLAAIIPISSDSIFENITFKQQYEIPIQVEKGDTFGKILSNYDIKLDERHNRLLKDVRKKFNVRKIFVGQQITLYLSGGHFKDMETKVEKIKFKIDEENSIIANWDSEELKYNITELKEKLFENKQQASGIITSSLYKAMQEQGVEVGVINSFINLFSFDVDFQRDIRKDDKFDIGFSEYQNKQGKNVRYGNIRFAELSVQGISKRYYKYETKSGREDYFDKNGESGRKALMKTPIEGARLSSSFGKRKHPVLGYNKLHKGTDFAAPKGTPIFAAGGGTVEYAGRNGSYGIYIRLRHNSSYKTAYAHMNGIARGVRTGKRVRQGQIIGYVGTTGRSTGNHLHYEVHRNGVAIDSRRMKLPSGKRLKGEELVKFKQFVEPMLPKN